MGYPQRLLDEGEEVVFDLNPHWKAVSWPLLLAPLVVFVTAFAASKVPDGAAQAPLRLAVAGVGAVLLLRFSVLPILRWVTTRFVVTTSRVVMRAGVLARRGRDIPIFRINDVTFEHSFFERLLGAGTLVVESAGERGQVALTDIPQVEKVQREIYRLIAEHDARRRAPWRDDEGRRDGPAPV